MRPTGTNGKQMSERAWSNLNAFVARVNRKLHRTAKGA